MGNGTRRRFVLFAVLVVAGLASAAWGLLRSGDWAGFALHLGLELGGALLTYALVVHGAGREEAGEKADLIARLGEADHDAALAAVRELRRRGWLGNGSLKGARLYGADLEGAGLAWATLSWADLRRARLRAVSLRGAVVRGVDLTGADLREADLADADMVWANLRGADLAGAELSVRTVLPDGTSWVAPVDLGRFTDPEHGEFWEPPWAARPPAGWPTKPSTEA